ncbi:MAG: PAS domain S-box protein [Bacteroidia bacterium]|nr:PAS domain S-box protein [Bacteroidia bacterium]
MAKVKDSRFNDFQGVIERIDFGIVYQNINGLIEYANQSAQDILGLTFEQLTGRDSMHPEWKSVHPDGSEFPGNEHPAMQTLATGKPVSNKVMGIYHPNKQDYVWILVNSYPVLDGSNEKINGVFTSFKDITTQYLTQNDLEYQLILSGILIDATTKFINLELSEIDNQINNLLARIGSFLKVDRFYVFSYNFEKGTVTNTHEWCSEGIIPQKDNLQEFPMEIVAPWVELNKQGKPFIMEDCSLIPDEDPFKQVLIEQEIQSIYCTPILVKNRCIGMVGFDAVKAKYKFNDYEKNLLAVFAQLIANIEERKENNTKIFEALKELNGVYQISQLNAEMGLTNEDYFSKACEVIRESFYIPTKTYVCLEYLSNKYTSTPYVETKNILEKELRSSDNILLGKVKIAIPENNFFLESETEFLTTISRLILQKYNKDLFAESLLASEEKYRIIADNNYNWEFWEAPDGTFLYHSPSCINTTGYAAEEMLSDPEICHVMLHPKDIKGYEEHRKEVTEKKCAGKHSFRITTKTGELKYIEHVCQPVYSKAGVYLGTRGSNIDITDKVEALNKLTKSEQRLNNLLNSQTSYVLRTDLRGYHTFWNKAFEDAFGWMYKESGLSEADSLSSICEYDHHKAKETVTKCFKEPGKIFKVQFDKPAKDGSVVHTAWDFVCILDELGNPTEIQCIGIDITDSVRAYNKLQESEQWLESLLNSQTNYVLRTDMQGRHTYWNHSFEEAFGWIYEMGLNQEDSLKSICEHHHPRTLEAVNECISNPGKIVKVELDKPGKNNDIRTTLWEFLCLTNSSGEPSEIQCMGIDITERRKAEKQLFESEENYRLLFENSPDPILLISPEGIIIDCNIATELMLLATKADIIGKTPYDISPEFQPNGKLSKTYVKEIIDEVIKSNQLKFEWVHQKFNGENVLVSITLTLVNFGGKSFLLTAWRDITELRKAEIEVKKLSTVTEQNPLGIFITDLKGKIEYANPSMQLISGYSNAELVGAYSSIFKSEFTSESTFNDLYESLQSGKEWQGKFYNKKKNGKLFIVQSNIAPIKNQDGEITHYFAVEEDITQQEQMHANLQASEQRFAELAQNSKTVIWEVDEFGKYTYVSAASLDVYGYHPHEMVGSMFVFNLHPESVREKYKQDGFAILNGGKNLGSWLNPKIKKDGTTIWTVSNGKPILDSFGKVIGFRGADNDVSAQVDAEERLKKSEIKYRLLFNVSPDPILIYNKEGQLLEFNEASCYLLNLSRDIVTDKNILDFSEQYQTNIKTGVKDLLEEYNNLCLEQGFVNYEWVLKSKNNRPVIVLVSCVAIDYNEGTAIYATWKNITAIKNAQEEIERFKTVMDQASYGSAINDLDGKFLYINKAFANMHGYEPEEVLGKDLTLFHSAEQRPEAERLVELLKENGEFVNEEVGHTHRNGQGFPTLMSGKLIKDEKGVPKFLSATCIDITDRKRTEQIILDLNQNLEQKVLDRTNELILTNKKLEVAKREADEANEAKSVFLSRMSHELRTPMNSILGFAQILEMTNLEEKQKKSVAHIIKSGTHLLNLINEVLDIARIESGKVSLSMESVEVNAVITEVLELVFPSAESRNISLNFVPSETYFVLADKQRLRQVIINVVNNAIKYNNVGGKVWIEAKRESDLVKIFIHDNGFGIKSDDVNKLFTPFERLDAEKYQIEGTGLGLSVVKQLMNSMGGIIGVESNYGQGSTFWLALSMAKSQEERIVELKESIQEISHLHDVNIVNKQTNTILYIEDNISNVELVETIISSTRPEINLVTNTYGANAVSLAKEHMPKLILLDLNLPDMHGSEVLDKLKLDPLVNKIPVVVVSADAMEKQVQYMLNLGAVRYLTKPIQMKEFLDLIDLYCK